MRLRLLPIFVLGALAAAGLTACGGDGGVLASLPSSESTTSTTAGPIGTTSLSTSSSSSSSSTSATTEPTTTTTSTTTTVAPLALEFRADGLGIVDFGAAPARTIAAVRDNLGFAPTFDSGWGPAWGDYGACPGTEHRHVEFDGLVLAFTDAGLFGPEGTRQFYSWAYLGTPEGITAGLQIGTTVADLQALYPAAEIGFDDMFFGHYFRVEYPDARGLWGTLTGSSPGDEVDFVIGGIGCGE